MKKKLVSIIINCFNGEKYLSKTLDSILKQKYKKFEVIFIDNCSTDNTIDILRRLAKNNKRIKVIINSRNFGHIRSPYHGIFQSSGDATVLLVSDLQDPPTLIKDFIEEWERGFKVVVGVKTKSEEYFLMFNIRKIYYRLIEKYSDTEQIKNFTGFGLYDKSFVQCIKELNDPYPYLRGLITELGFERKEIEYTQPQRN